MYCKNCGKEMNENAAVCLGCGASKNTGKAFCSNCGSPINENAAICLACGAGVKSKSETSGTSEKTKMIAALLAIFLGHLGIHWFYLGEKQKGIRNILLSVGCVFLMIIGVGLLGFVGLWIYNIITAVQIFQGKINDAEGNELA